MARALKRLGRPADVGESGEVRGEEDSIETHHLRLYGYHLVPLVEHVADGARAELAEARLEVRRVAVRPAALVQSKV